jgi:hypothetical protein
VQFVIFSHTLARFPDGSGVAVAHPAVQGSGLTMSWGHLPTGACNNMSVEPTAYETAL